MRPGPSLSKQHTHCGYVDRDKDDAAPESAK